MKIPLTARKTNNEVLEWMDTGRKLMKTDAVSGSYYEKDNFRKTKLDRQDRRKEDRRVTQREVYEWLDEIYWINEQCCWTAANDER